MGGESARWRRKWVAVAELMVLLVALAGVLALGRWVSEPVASAVHRPTREDCTAGRFAGPPLLRLELAAPNGQGSSLTTFDELVGCTNRTNLGEALRESTFRDFRFIPAYVLLLLWCSARIGGFAESDRTWWSGWGVFLRSPLARVDRNQAGRLVGQVAAWSVPVAGSLDLAENGFLLHTARALVDDRSPSDTVLQLTAGLAAGKFALLALPFVLVVVLLWLLFSAILRSKVIETLASAVDVPGLDDPGRRWRIPEVDANEELKGVIAQNPSNYGICFSGGGVRSATFALGALQELEQLGDTPVEDDPAGEPKRKNLAPWNISCARYLSAVSGGSYMAASYQFLARGGRGADSSGDRHDLEQAPNPTRRGLHSIGTAPVIGRPARWVDQKSLPPTPVLGPPSPPGKRPLVRPAGPVEDHLRRHSTHLADGAAEWILAVAEVIIKAASGLFILLLTIWAIAVPLGWIYRYGFHGLSDTKPSPSVDLRTIAGPAVAFLTFLLLRGLARIADVVSQRRLGAGRTTRARDQARAATSFAVLLLLTFGTVLPFVAANVESATTRLGQWAGLATDPQTPDLDKVNGHLADVVSGTSAAAVAAGKAAAVINDSTTQSGSLRASAGAAEVAAGQGEEAVAALARLMDGDDKDDDDRLGAPVLAVRFDPESCRPVTPETEIPVAGAPDSIAIRACEAGLSAAVSADAVAATARAVGLFGPGSAATSVAEAAAAATAGASKAGVAVRRLATELSGSAAAPTKNPPVAWAGMSALVTLIGALNAKRQKDGAKKAPPTGPSKWDKLVKAVGFGGVGEVVAGIAAALLSLIAFSDVVVDSWRRGVGAPMKVVVEQPAWAWWLAATALLIFLVWRMNANTWSLRPFHHRRLWLPYAVTPAGQTADWRTDTRFSEVGRKVDGFPELIICAAAQTSGREWAPPGRRALSFVFTADAVGGPEVGYVRTRTLEALLGTKHRSAITLFGAVATSGAAFGPAMGRQSKGGMGAVMAMANARLGAWLPNPHHLARLAAVEKGGGSLRTCSLGRRPRLWYWFMEIAGQYPTDAKLVLTTDGGHVENLGLVELLRRRCSRILCFDASGAGSTPATLAEAIVMAREELDVKITLQSLPGSGDGVPPTTEGEAVVSPRPDGSFAVEFSLAGRPAAAPGVLVPGTFGADPLHRRAGMIEALAARIAGRPVLVAKIEYPAVDGEPAVPASTGWLVYGTLALANPGAEEWDLLEYAHRHDVFPNDGTVRQWFDASTFSAYQQLGRRTARRMVDEAVAFKIPVA